MKTAFREWLIYLLARTSDWLLVRLVGKIASAWIKGMANYSYNINLNGEMRALKILGRHGMATIFDVGANVGEWSELAASANPGASVHGFELAPATYEMLDKRVGGHPQITAQPFGLSDREGVTDFFFFPDHEVHSSMVALVDYEHRLEQGQTRRGEDYCRDQGIERVDFLKIDVEGVEHLVLKGFEDMLKNGRIRVIQFEYGPPNLSSGFMLRDFHALLEPFGFRIGKIYPHTVKFKAYAPADDNFMGGNFLAVQATDSELMQELRNR